MIFCLFLYSEPDDSIELEELNTNKDKRSITPPIGHSSHITYAEDIEKVRNGGNCMFICLLLSSVQKLIMEKHCKYVKQNGTFSYTSLTRAFQQISPGSL